MSKKTSSFTVAAFLGPVFLGGLGLLFASASPLAQGDWLGMGLVVRAGGALTLAALGCLGCTLGAFLRGEPKAWSTAWVAFPSAAFLTVLLLWLGPAYQGNRQVHRTMDLRRTIISDAAFRESFVFSDRLSIKEADIFKDREAADALTPDQVRHLWLTLKTIQTGWNFDALILSKNTPPDVLEEYYHMVMDAATRANGHVWPEALLSRDNFLLHPNLPPTLLSEINAFNNPPLLEKLARRTPVAPKATEVKAIEIGGK